jgi:transposase
MGRQTSDRASLFYEFRLEDRIPKGHLLRRINMFMVPVLGSVREQLKLHYSEIGRPSVDPELMIRMLMIGYCYGLRSERKLSQEVELHLAYRWFCRLDLDDKVRTTQPSRRIGSTGSGRSISFATYSSVSSALAWPVAWSRVRASPSMPA